MREGQRGVSKARLWWNIHRRVDDFSCCTEIPEEKKKSSNKNTPHPFFHPCPESLISHSQSCPTFAFSKSRSLPMVVSRRQRHSRDSSSWFFSSFTTQSCMIASVSIFSLKSSPMNFIFPMDLRRALSLASSSSSWSRVFSSGCKTEK